MRKLMLLIVMFSIVAWWQHPVEAKGPASRIIISSPALDEDIIVEDNGLIALLSMTGLEDFRFKLVEEPSDIDVGYELQRQYASGNSFTTFDRVMYYPSTRAKGGYVHYLGIVNGSSGYDNHWYNARPEAELAFKHILNYQHLKNYLLAYGGNGDILFLDPQSLDIQLTLDTQQKEWAYVEDSAASLDGTRLFFRSNSNASSQQNVLDLSSIETCSLGASAFVMPTLDGNHLLFQVGNILQVRDAQTYELAETITLEAETNIHFFPNDTLLEAIATVYDAKTGQLSLLRVDGQSFETSQLSSLDGIASDVTAAWDNTFGQFYIAEGDHLATWQMWDESMDTSGTLGYSKELQEFQEAGIAVDMVGTHHGQLYYYPRLGRYQKWDTSKMDEITGGIFVAHPYDRQSLNEHILSDMSFQHVIMAGNRLYALETPPESETSTIYQIDIDTGEILNSVEVSPDIHYLGYEELDTTFISTETVTLGACNISIP